MRNLRLRAAKIAGWEDGFPIFIGNQRVADAYFKAGFTLHLSARWGGWAERNDHILDKSSCALDTTVYTTSRATQPGGTTRDAILKSNPLSQSLSASATVLGGVVGPNQPITSSTSTPLPSTRAPSPSSQQFPPPTKPSVETQPGDTALSTTLKSNPISQPVSKSANTPR